MAFAALAGAGDETINTGSGFLIAPSGYILTNYHVVAAARQVGVVLHNGVRHEADIIALDEYNDLALLKIEGTDFANAAIASSQTAQVMEHVMLLGFPFVQSVGTEVSMSDGRINSIRHGSRIPLFQIDANLNSGGSGGPLVNDKGEVVGIAVAKLNALAFIEQAGTLPERINFAIPIDEARYLVHTTSARAEFQEQNWNGTADIYIRSRPSHDPETWSWIITLEARGPELYSVPDSGTTAAMLALALGGLWLLKRRVCA